MATEPERPNDLIARYPTAGGSWVDVTQYPRAAVGDWTCHGCRDGGMEVAKQLRGVASSHASSCTAIQL